MKLIKLIPDSITIVLSILLVFIALTWIVPAGEYEREQLQNREVVKPGTYVRVESQPQGFFTFFTTPIKGFVKAAEIIGFVFLVGGAFGIITHSGAISSGLSYIIGFSIRKPAFKKMVIPFLMVLFSLAGATFGMSEEVLVFILICIPLARALGYDSIVGVTIPFIGAGAGFAGAFSNPFTIGIAQGIAEIPLFSGWEYRLIVWVVFTAIAILFTTSYANKIEKKPELSPVYEIDKKRKNNHNSMDQTDGFKRSHKFVLMGLATAILILVVGVSKWDWYITEIAALFIGLGIFSAIVSRIASTVAVKAFLSGAKEMMTAAMVIALTTGLMVVARDGKIIDTILHLVANIANQFHPAVSVQMMFLFQGFLNFFMPSGSGQAALTMPIMAPLSDLIGISRQTAVLAFQLGDGLFNMMIPTSGVTMGVLAIAEVPYQKWLKWILPLMGLFLLVGMLLLVPPVLFGW